MSLYTVFIVKTIRIEEYNHFDYESNITSTNQQSKF